MKFCKRFVARQTSIDMAYIDYKMLKKRLHAGKGEADHDAQWVNALWMEIERVNSCVEETELYLLSVLHKLTKDHDPEQRKAAIAEDCDFVSLVHHFQLDLALNLIACVKICKKHDKERTRRPILPGMCDVLLNRRLLAINLHSTLTGQCKNAIKATSTLEEEMIIAHAATLASKMKQYRASTLDEPPPPHYLEVAMPTVLEPRLMPPEPSQELLSSNVPDVPSFKQLLGDRDAEPRSQPLGNGGGGPGTSPSISPGRRLSVGSLRSLSPFKKRADGALPFALAALQQPAGTVDPALIFSMERTFLSSMNQSFYLMLIGAQLMAINDFDHTPITIGTVIILFGIANIVVSYCYHIARFRVLRKREVVGTNGSNAWLGFLTGTAVIASIIELAYLYVYPQLDRAKSVELAGLPESGSGHSILGT